MDTDIVKEQIEKLRESQAGMKSAKDRNTAAWAEAENEGINKPAMKLSLKLEKMDEETAANYLNCVKIYCKQMDLFIFPDSKSNVTFKKSDDSEKFESSPDILMVDVPPPEMVVTQVTPGPPIEESFLDPTIDDNEPLPVPAVFHVAPELLNELINSNSSDILNKDEIRKPVAQNGSLFVCVGSDISGLNAYSVVPLAQYGGETKTAEDGTKNGYTGRIGMYNNEQYILDEKVRFEIKTQK